MAMKICRRGIHNYLQKRNFTNIPAELLEKGQNRVIDASLTLIREQAKLKVCRVCVCVIVYTKSLFISVFLSFFLAANLLYMTMKSLLL